VVPALQLLPALLVQLPSLRVELIKEAPPLDGMAYRSVDRPRQMGALHSAWHELQLKHPDRVTITVLAKRDSDPLGSWSD